MHPCPSCSAPLDDEGVCTSCGALTRGFFRGLDLGAPQIAEAVANGLDFYLLLGVANTDDTHTIARRYRQLRVLFPDDPSRLAPIPARKLALLEHAGRALTDPQLRRMYDDLCAGDARVSNAVVTCIGCGAPLATGASRCAFCGTPRPVAAEPPAAPPEAGPPQAEPVDYYAMLGLTPAHLFPPAESFDNSMIGGFLSDWNALDQASSSLDRSLRLPNGPPTTADVDAAALTLQKQMLLSPGYTPEEREDRLHELDVARRILRTENWRSRYDMLLMNFRQGQLGSGRLDALRALQDLALADMAEERGETLAPAQANALLRQGIGYLDARLPREAIQPLRRALAALPDSATAHEAYARALLASDDPLSLGSFALRQALTSLDYLAQHELANTNHIALAALCRGLLARDGGDAAVAAQELQRAAELDASLAAAWRGLAAIELSRGALDAASEHCRRAVALDARDERALMMLAAACVRSNRRGEAREVAAQIAALRGEGWSSEAVLRELTD